MESGSGCDNVEVTCLPMCGHGHVRTRSTQDSFYRLCVDGGPPTAYADVVIEHSADEEFKDALLDAVRLVQVEVERIIQVMHGRIPTKKTVVMIEWRW